MLYRSRWKGSLKTAPTLLLGFAVLFWYLSAGPYTGWLQYLRPYATGLVLVTVICSAETFVTRILSSRPAKYVATISYALYIVHPATMYGWFNEGGVWERYLLKRPISFAITFLAAHLSTFYWEHYWTQAGKKWIARRRQQHATRLQEGQAG
jgi:peptidoglycan/LPS O-acetylase OafA/YrhL